MNDPFVVVYSFISIWCIDFFLFSVIFADLFLLNRFAEWVERALPRLSMICLCLDFVSHENFDLLCARSRPDAADRFTKLTKNVGLVLVFIAEFCR